MDRWILVDHLIDIALTDEPDEVTDRLLRAVLAFTGGQQVAIFEVRQEALRLSASRGIGQAALDEVERAWISGREELRGAHHVCTGGGIAYPILVKEHLVAVLFTERTPVASFEDPRDVQALGQFARLAGRNIARRWAEPGGYLAATTPDDLARDQLLVLLEQNEWNIARVARILDVTRPTIYARLERFGLPRQKVAKRRPSKQSA